MIICNRKEELEKEVGNLQHLLEITQLTLQMMPNNLHVAVVVLDDARQVQDAFYDRYKVGCKYTHFMSLSLAAMWLSLRDVTRDVVVHENAHIIVEKHYGSGKTPFHVHEWIAQGAAKNWRRVLK